MRKTINPKTIYHWAKRFDSGRAMSIRRGRPQSYSVPLILTMASLQNLYDLSFREALERGEEVFDEIPCLSTFHYRVSTLDPELVTEFIKYLGLALQHEFYAAGKPITFFIIDGTGFSYHDSYPLQFLRGTEVRKVQSHVRAVALAASTGKERFYIGAVPGEAYASETRMAERLLPRFTFFNQLPFLGDKGFDSVQLLKHIKDRGALPALRIKETAQYCIKDPERLASKENERIYGGKRTLIEGLFGNTKQKTTSHIKVFKNHTAQTYALLRLALYDIYLLAEFEKKRVLAVIFRTASLKVDKLRSSLLRLGATSPNFSKSYASSIESCKKDVIY